MILYNILLFMQPKEGEESNPLMSFLPLVLIIAVFYLFFIRPQMKKAKDERKYREGLKKGDKIITAGGIHGKILEIGESTFIIEVEGQNRLKIEKSSVSLNRDTQPGQKK